MSVNTPFVARRVNECSLPSTLQSWGLELDWSPGRIETGLPYPVQTCTLYSYLLSCTNMHTVQPCPALPCIYLYTVHPSPILYRHVHCPALYRSVHFIVLPCLTFYMHILCTVPASPVLTCTLYNFACHVQTYILYSFACPVHTYKTVQFCPVLYRHVNCTVLPCPVQTCKLYMFTLSCAYM